MNNAGLAEHLFLQALAVCPSDPLTCNELGIVAYGNGALDAAESWFQRALDSLPDHVVFPGGVLGLGAMFRPADALQASCFQKALL